MRILLSLALAVTTFMLGAGAVSAATPTPTLTSTVTATPTPPTPTATPTLPPLPTATAIDLAVHLDEQGLSWHAAPGAASYKLTATIGATESGPAGECTPSAGQRFVPIDIDRTFPSTTTSVPLNLPPLAPGDHWTIHFELISLVAVDRQGAQIAGYRSGQIVEACDLGHPQPTPAIKLPSTGATASDGHNMRVGFAFALSVGGLLCFATLYVRSRRSAV